MILVLAKAHDVLPVFEKMPLFLLFVFFFHSLVEAKKINKSHLI